MRKNILTITIIMLAGLAAMFVIQCSNEKGTNSAVPILESTADHVSAAAFLDIPETYIQQAKSQYSIFYGHTSHGSQVVAGMAWLRASNSLYDYNNGEGTLTRAEYSGDLGGTGDTAWVAVTRERLNQPDNGINVVMWSWCGGCSDNTVDGINIYLNAMNGLEQTYPGVTFIYMTGHLDGTGIDGNLYARNNQIREYCETNHKVLFDFADIESYDPDGNYYPDASDACEWCYDWSETHDGDWYCGCSHSHCFNCYLKGRAFWWMMARMAGWDGAST